MTLSCTIQGNAVSMLAGSFSAAYMLNNRPTGSMRAYFDGMPVGDEGDEVVVTRTSDSVVMFAGRITSVRVSVDEAGNKFASYSLSGHEVLADRRIVGEVYINKTTGFIVGDLISKYLAGDGITAGTIDTGVLVPRAVFGYQQLSNVLRALAEANGYIWYIDTAKALHFTERDLLSAPVDIDEVVSGEWAIRGLRYERSLTQYRNRQFVQYNELTAERTERFAGDGQTKTWNVEFPIASKPDVFVNDVAKTVGISGLDPDGTADFYWSSGSPTVAQDLLATALSGIDPDNPDRQRLVGYTSPITSFSNLQGLHINGEYLVAGFGDINGGYVLYKNNGTLWEQVGNLRVFSGLSVDLVVGFGDYFLSWESDGFDVDINIYRIVGDTITFVSTVETLSTFNAITQRLYRQSNGNHVACTQTTGILTDPYVLIVAPDGTTATATGLNSGLSSSGREFIGYHEAYCFVRDVSGGGWILRQLFIQDSVYSITADPTNLTGTFNGNFASTNGYAFFGTSAGIEVYQRSGQTATLTKLSTITPPSGYTFAETFGTGRWTQMAVYDDWLIVPVDESPYILTYRIDRVAGSVDYVGPYDSGVTDAPLFAVAGSLGFFVGVWNDNEIAGAYTGTLGADVLKVVYFGSFPNVTQVDDFAEQTARIAIEGGTGIYESFQSASDTDTEPAAIDIGQAILERYGKVPRVISFETQIEGFDTGQIVQINWPSLGIIDEEYLIERMGIRDEMATTIWYQLNCISGRDIGNWQEFWRSLRGDAASFDFGGSDILPKAAAVQDLVTVTEEVTAVTLATETNWDEGNWDEMEWQ